MTAPEPKRMGALALVGSGEYTAAMEATDRILLETLGPGRARVAVIPTASALEPGQPERWNGMGVAHFDSLGADVTPLLLLSRADADAPLILDTLGRQQFYYFSGGSPDHCIETLAGTLAWAAIRERHLAGAALAGCSAGAMMLGSHALGVRAIRRGEPPRWRPALGLVPDIGVMPHFDRMLAFMSEETFRAVLDAAPPGMSVIGIDEDTALLRLSTMEGQRWRVSGRGSVTVYRHGSDPEIYQDGAEPRISG